MSLALAVKGPAADIVDVDFVVVRADGEILVIGREGHNLTPLPRVLDKVGLNIGGAHRPDRDGTVIASNGDPVIVASDSTRALGVRQFGESGGTATLGLDRAVRDLDGLLMGAGDGVPDHDLVVIARGDNAAIWLLVEAPDLTVGVRAHDVLAVGTVDIAKSDGAVTLADEKRAAVEVDGTDEAELKGGFDGLGVGVNAVKLAVLATGEELAVHEADSRDEALVGLDGALACAAIITAPDVDATVGATSVASTVVTPGDASERGHIVAAVETLGLLTTGLASIPEADVLPTGGGESLGARLLIPSDIHDLVLVTLVLEDEVAGAVVAVDVVIVVEIDSADHILGVDVTGSDATSTLGDLHAVLLLTSAGVPGEDARRCTNLAGDGSGASFVDRHAHNIIGVMVGVLSDVLGGVSDLTTTEEFLGVGAVVQDDTESSGHVDSVVLGVEVDVLLRVSATVAVDVLKFVGLSGLRVVDRVVVVRLSDLSYPGTDGHELLAFFLVDFKEIVLLAIVVFATIVGDRLAGLLVVANTVAITFHVAVVVELARRRSAR